MFKFELKTGIQLSLLICTTLLALAFVGYLGINGMNSTNAALGTVYNHRIVNLGHLMTIARKTLENRNLLLDAARHRNPDLIAEKFRASENNKRIITDTWKAYRSTELAPKENELAKQLEADRQNFFDNGLKPAWTALKNDMPDEAEKLIDTVVEPYYTPVSKGTDALLQLQVDASKQEYEASQQSYASTRTTILEIIFAAIALVSLVNISFAWNLRRKLGCEPSEAASIMRNIAEGRLDFSLNAKGKNQRSLVVMTKKAVDAIQSLIADANFLSEAAVEGRLEVRADASKHQGDFRKVVEGVNATLDAVIGPLNVAAKYVDAIAQGHIPPKISDSYNGDFNTIKNNLNTCIEAVNALVADANLLSEAAVAGRLDTRADASKHQGDFRKVVEGVNATLDAVIGPLNVAAKYVDAIAQGHIPPKISDSYNGDFNTIKNNLNTCIDAVNALVADANLLSEAAVAGRLDIRADASKHQGDFRKVVEGVNATLDAVIGPLNVAAKYVDAIAQGHIPPKISDSYNGDFNTIKNNLNTCIDAVNALVADANFLSEAAVEGRLDTRADATKHQGDFRKVVEGVNATLDAVIGPLNVAAKYVDAIAQGHIPPKISDSYNGDFNTIKNNLNTCIEAVNALVADTHRLSEAAQEGRVQTRADASKHRGEFRNIVEGINATLETIVAPVLVVKTAADAINIAAREISAGNADLSHRTEQQAASLEETASSMEQLASTVKQNADNAQQASRMAIVASDIAVQGGSRVQQVAGKMKAINDSARKIVDIIGVIDGIAGQTNILALNAAVEAARAGEQGRGFAVVASEVRTLAHRSAAAAKEIKGLISDSVERVNEGTRLVGEAGQTMDEIVSSVQRVTDIMTEIATASAEQSAGIEQVNQAIVQMDDVTQQNAALVEQAAAAAESLEEQAAMLAESMKHFRLDAFVEAAGAQHSIPHYTIQHRSMMSLISPSAKTRNIDNLKLVNAGQSEEEWSEF
ncbi:MAG: methyl-accepting chemotaxis protein [Methylomicrobium sp.]